MNRADLKFAILLNVPEIDKVVQKVVTEIGIAKGFAIYRKAIMAAGKIGQKAIQAELQKRSGKFSKNKKHGLKYGGTGALPAAMKVQGRTNRDGLYSYAVVGTDRGFKTAAKRGQKMADVVPANHVHLVNNGFVAVSRIPGVVGRDQGYKTVQALRAMGQALKIQRARTLSMRRLLGHKLDSYYTVRANDSNKVQNLKYIAGYKGVKKTTVKGRHFMEGAAITFGPQATEVAISVLKTELDKVISSMGA